LAVVILPISVKIPKSYTPKLGDAIQG
jgi:hypothetical protein